MAKTDFKSVDEYLAAQPEAARDVLERVRATISAALPGAKEVISYQIPAYKLDGRTIIYFAGWKEHFSIYPVGKKLIASLGADAGSLEVNDKGTIRFPIRGPIPLNLIERITMARMESVGTESKVKKKAAKRDPARKRRSPAR